MNEPVLHVFDLETSALDIAGTDRFMRANGNLDYVQEFLRASEDPSVLWKHPLYRAHDRSQILQMAVTGKIQGLGPKDKGWNKVKPDLFSPVNNGTLTPYEESLFSRQRSHLSKAIKFGQHSPSEDKRIRLVYGQIQRELEAGHKVTLAGHNIGRFDLWKLEHAVHQYDTPEMHPLRGQIARWVKEYPEQFGIRDTLHELHTAALELAARDIDFRVNHFRGADELARAFRVGGGNLTNIARHLSGDLNFAAHDAWGDVGQTVDLAHALTVKEGRDDLLRRIFRRSSTPIAFTAEVAKEEVKAAPSGILHEFSQSSKLKYGVAGAAAALALGTYWAHSTRRDRQTQITGLRDEGMAVKSRHRLTSFGSGWQGLKPTPPQFQLESEDAYNPWLRAAGFSAAGGALYGVHRYKLATDAKYAPMLHRWAKKFEDYSPMHLGRTFGISDRLAAYTIVDPVEFTHGMLTHSDGSLNATGRAFQFQFDRTGQAFDVLKETKDAPLVFHGRRIAGDAYSELVNRPGINLETILVPSESRPAGTAARMAQELTDPAIKWPKIGNWWSRYQAIRASQHISNTSPYAEDVKNGITRWRPFHSRSWSADPLENAARKARSVGSRVNVELLSFLEPPQRLMAGVGVGLKPGSWNKWAHFPGIGEGGIVNQMLTKRVLPAVLGVTALGWLDYHIGHPSDKVIDLGLKANVLRADLTDMAPGGRGITDFYANTVPGPQYGPLALPALGAFAGGVWHYGKVIRNAFRPLESRKFTEDLRKASARLWPAKEALAEISERGTRFASVEGVQKVWKTLGLPGKGAVLGAALMLPFVPGMLGSRTKGSELRDIYSGNEPVPVRSGRWWEVGSTPFGGTRIKAWRPHWSLLRKSHAEDISLYGSEAEKWKHNPIVHPLRWLKNPYWLEEQHFQDRPYPVTSPAFTNVPLVGPLMAATVGKVFKPEVRMHEQEWGGDNYTLYSTRLEPKGPDALPPPRPKTEYSLLGALKQEVGIAKEYNGATGFTLGSLWEAAFPDIHQGKEVYFQGARQMSNVSRRYYERELGAGIGPSPAMDEAFGYTEPLRRFIQRESFEPQANEIRNTMPSWLPGDDYMTNFKVGDPYVRVDDGYARLPGAGYAALHPEVEGLNPEDYPDIHKLSILSDVAPYSREYNTYRQRVATEARGDTRLQIELDKITDRVKQTKDSSVLMDERRFTAPVETIEGTVDKVSPGGITLQEYPGRTFSFSSVGMSSADLSARVLGENNDLTKDELAAAVDERKVGLFNWFAENVTPGSSAKLTIPKGAAENSEAIRAVVEVDGKNINQALLDEGLADLRRDKSGAEYRAMFGIAGRISGKAAEALAYGGDFSPGHTKIWQQRTALTQYINNEVVGTRMRRWERPIHDFIMPYARGAGHMLTGEVVIPHEVQVRRDLNTLSDTLQYLRGINDDALGNHTRQGQRTSTGANLFSSPVFVGSTLPAREVHYFRSFLNETDVDKREAILKVASPEMARALSAQWVTQGARLASAEGQDPGEIGDNGRPYTKADVKEYDQANTKLGYGDWVRSKEVADFFSRTGFSLPEENSPAYNDALDYEDVKLKLIQQEGYDAHDFNIFDDRVSMLWRKPYVDGAVRELTTGDTSRSSEQLRQTVERMILASKDKNPRVVSSVHASPADRASVRVDASIDQTDAMLRDIRLHPDKYDPQE